MRSKILLVVVVLFFAGMLFLTMFAEQIHIASLTEVTAGTPEQKKFSFEYTDENGRTQIGWSQKIVIPEAMIEEGVFVVYHAEKNGTRRTFVRLAAVETGEKRDGYVEIVSGITLSDRIVTESSAKLYDGAEVAVK